MLFKLVFLQLISIKRVSYKLTRFFIYYRITDLQKSKTIH